MSVTVIWARIRMAVPRRRVPARRRRVTISKIENTFCFFLRALRLFDHEKLVKIIGAEAMSSILFCRPCRQNLLLTCCTRWVR